MTRICLTDQNLRSLLDKAYLEGFLRSGEGCNGEYPFNRDPVGVLASSGFCYHRNQAVRELLTIASTYANPGSCRTCSNRGRVNGLSQESFCDSCVYQESWRKNHYHADPSAKSN